MKNKKLSKAGFTLLELMVVVLIIGVLISVALPSYRRAVDKAEMAKVLATFHLIEQSMQRYRLANGSWPTNIEDLDIQIPPSKWRYSLEDSTGQHLSTEREQPLWPNSYRTQPRGYASIRADKPSMVWGPGMGAVFYSIKGRTAYNLKPGVFCCLWASGGSQPRWEKFCNSVKEKNADAGACYTGTKIAVRSAN